MTGTDRDEVEALREENARLKADVAYAAAIVSGDARWEAVMTARQRVERERERADSNLLDGLHWMDKAEARREAIDRIRECRSCLGAGPMDYEAFTEEVDAALDALGACRCPGDPHGYKCTAHAPLDASSGSLP